MGNIIDKAAVEVNKDGSRGSEPIKNIFYNYVFPVTSETVKLLPDSLLVGSGLLALLTFSSYYLLFFVTISELCIIQQVISSILINVNPDAFKNSNDELKCKTGYKTASLYNLGLTSLVTTNSRIPDPLIFILSSASFYIYAMYFHFNETFLALGSEQMGRVYTSLIATACAILAIIIWRISMDCKITIFDLTASVLFGLIGFAIFYQNLQFFGEDTVNLMGIPLSMPVSNVCIPKD